MSQAALFLSVEQLAEALGVGKATVYAWTAQVGPASIPRVRLGKRLGFTLTDVVEWLKREQDPRQERAPVRARRMPARIRRRAQVRP